MNRKIVLITGANRGIGFEAARQQAAMGAQVVMICRDRDRGRSAQRQIAQEVDGRAPLLFIADLASQASIRSLADQLHSRFSHLDVLINNAGAIFSRREPGPDGIERTFALNHLAPFLLTRLLFDLLHASRDGRVITMSSEIHSSRLDFNNLQGERHYNFLDAYNQSKLENILFTYELARRAARSGVTVNSLSPGPTNTRFGDDLTGLPALFPTFMKRIPYLFADPKESARSLVYLAASQEVSGISGKFFLKKKETRSRPISYNPEVARRLWEISEDLTHRKAGKAETVKPVLSASPAGY